MSTYSKAELVMEHVLNESNPLIGIEFILGEFHVEVR